MRRANRTLRMSGFSGVGSPVPTVCVCVCVAWQPKFQRPISLSISGLDDSKVAT